MNENLKQEALLRHLLSRKSNPLDDEFLYSVLLGFRLFLSPHQLLTELHRLSTEDVTQNVQRTKPENTCSKCHQLHISSRPVATPSSSRAMSKVLTAQEQQSITSASSTSITTVKQKGADSAPQKFISTTFIQVSSSNTRPAESLVVEGEDTIRRRRRGRRRNTVDTAETEPVETRRPNVLDNVLSTDRSSTLSRDSGILSAVIDFEELDSANNNSVAAKMNKRKKPFENCNDSGYSLNHDLATNCTQCLPHCVQERNTDFKKQLVHVLHEWVRHFPADFRNKKIMWTLNDVIKTCQSEKEELRNLCTEVVDCLSRRTAAQESYEQQLSSYDQQDSLKTTQKGGKKDWMVNFVLKLKNTADVNEMAQQLCIVETDFLKHVGAEEFLQLFTADGDEDVRTNLGACVRWFNRLSHLVATLICMCRKRKHGRHIITFFARVANRCFELSNFNSAMAILTGLSLGPVTRLKRTWNKLVLSELGKLQNVFDPSNNFLKYRSIYMSRIAKTQSPAEVKSSDELMNRFSVISQHSITSATSTASHQGDSGIECDHDTPTPGCKTSPCSGTGRLLKKHFCFESRDSQAVAVVPFLVLLVKDVYFLNHAIPTVDDHGNINFEKLRNLSNILSPLEDWKQMAQTYQKHDEIQDFLLRSPVQEDADLYLLSYKREAPTNRFEKQQLKTLKIDRDAKKRNEAALTKSMRRKTM